MIDWEKSAELNGVTEDELRARFSRFPNSGKRVIAVCDGCGKERNIGYDSYRGLCKKCSSNTPEAIKRQRDIIIERLSDPIKREALRLVSAEYWACPESRDKQSEQKIQYIKDNPCAMDAVRLGNAEYFSTPDAKKAHSDAKKKYYMDNPDARKILSIKLKKYHEDHPETYTASDEIKCGGNDIVGHHMIYDHADLSRNIMYMTRSIHTKIHHLFRRHGIDIPHININSI